DARLGERRPALSTRRHLAAFNAPHSPLGAARRSDQRSALAALRGATLSVRHPPRDVQRVARMLELTASTSAAIASRTAAAARRVSFVESSSERTFVFSRERRIASSLTCSYSFHAAAASARPARSASGAFEARFAST